MRIFASAVLIGVFTFCSFGLSVDAFTLPDTGQDKCYHGFYYDNEIPCGSLYPGQDAEYRQGPEPDYWDNGDGTVQDVVTGLTWQKTDDGVKRVWEVGLSYCEALELGDYADWRLPSRHELLFLLDYGNVNPAIDTSYFPECRNDWYWSSTPVLAKASYYRIKFSDGGEPGSVATEGDKWDFAYVRCVRGGVPQKSSFVDNGNGTVTDTTTGRMWQKGDYFGSSVWVWEKHLAYCEDLQLAGYDDWRLPNIRELETLLDDTRSPAIAPVFEGRNYGELSSSTSFTGDPSYVFVVSIDNGSVHFRHKDNGRSVRCVRLGLQQQRPIIKVKPTPLFPLLLE